MTDPEEMTPGPDDTAAFQRFYSNERSEQRPRGLLYRVLVGWWRRRG